MTDKPQTTPSDGGGQGTSMRTSEQKEAVFLRFVQMTENRASALEIKRELRLSDSQYQTCVNLWYDVFQGRQAGKATVSASCLPLEVRAIMGLTSGDSLSVDIPFDKGGSSFCHIIKEAGPDESSLN